MRGAARARGRGQARPRHKHRFDHGEPIATIDTRPIAFVALFLAVFGIIWGAGQIKTHAVTVHLPMVWGVSPEYTPSFVTIQIDEAGAVMFDGEILPLDQLAGRIREVSADYEVVLFQASPNTAFETVLRALGEIREAGIEPYDIQRYRLMMPAHEVEVDDTVVQVKRARLNIYVCMMNEDSDRTC